MKDNIAITTELSTKSSLQNYFFFIACALDINHCFINIILFLFYFILVLELSFALN